MRKLISKVVNIYVVVFFIGFPLFLSETYLNTLNDKLYFMIISTAVAAVGVIFAFIVGLISEGAQRETKRIRNKKDPGVQESFGAFISHEKTVLSLPLIFLIIFIISLGISTICSDWTYEAFWGNMGRSQGMYVWLYYAAAVLMVGIFFEPKKYHIDIFLFVGILISVWGILDYFYMSPIGWQETVSRFEQVDFSSGFGNITVVSQAEGMYFLAASAMYVSEEDTKRRIYYLIAALVSMSGLIVVYADNALFSIAVFAAFLPFYAVRNKKGILSFLTLVSGCLLMLVLAGFYGLDGSDPWDYRYQHHGVLLKLATGHRGLCAGLLAVSLLIFILSFAYFHLRGDAGKDESLAADSDGKRARFLRAIWVSVLIVLAFAFLYVLYDANIAGHAARYGAASEYLVFNDEWGTHRGYNWRLAFGYITEHFSLREFLFGTGPETYAIYTTTYDYYNMLHAFGETYDSLHNEVLQIFFTTGLLGFVSYYGMIASACVTGFRASGTLQRQLGIAFAYALISYVAVSVITVSGPVVTPLMLISLGVACACGRRPSGEKV